MYWLSPSLCFHPLYFTALNHFTSELNTALKAFDTFFVAATQPVYHP
jgi:hypothetical protein